MRFQIHFVKDYHQRQPVKMSVLKELVQFLLADVDAFVLWQGV